MDRLRKSSQRIERCPQKSQKVKLCAQETRFSLVTGLTEFIIKKMNKISQICYSTPVGQKKNRKRK